MNKYNLKIILFLLASRVGGTAVPLRSVEDFISYSGSQNLRIESGLIDILRQ